MFFSGKGGVGKTTLAAATAVSAAGPDHRVLLLSTDPAHNLSDVLQLPLGAEPRQIAKGLDAMEVDARGLFTGNADDAPGPVSELMRLARETPGVDELGAIEILLEVLERAEHDVVIVDTAPTGHTLRLLAVPQLLDGWLGTLMQLRQRLAKTTRVLRKLWPGARDLDDDTMIAGLSDGRVRFSQLQQQLRDADQAQIVLVTIPEALSVLETVRTLNKLTKENMAVATIVVNQFQPEQDCPHCQRRRQIHLEQLEHLQRQSLGVNLRIVQSVPQQIRGVEALRELGQSVWG